MGSWLRWGMILGFALGGFFDGILLHQILQWHHLLSLVPAVNSLRLQVLWDGWFHALMYLVAAAAIWGLWRTRGEGARRAGKPLLGALLVGFGGWHMADALLSHWLLGIHRIRLDSPDPLLWDLLWLGAFGIAPALVGLLLLRGSRPAAGRGGRSTLAVLLVGLLAGGMALWSIQEPQDQDFTTIVFAPRTTPAQVYDALAATEARLVWTDRRMGVVVVQMPAERRLGLYGRGAWLVSGAGAPGGCIGWSRAT